MDVMALLLLYIPHPCLSCPTSIHGLYKTHIASRFPGVMLANVPDALPGFCARGIKFCWDAVVTEQVLYIAYENGFGDQHVVGCCNNYVRLDMSQWF